MEYFWIFLLFLNGLLYVILFSRRKRRHGEPPQVRHKYPFVGGTFDFGQSPLGYLRKLNKMYGDVATVLLAGREVHFFTNPMDIKYLEKSRDLKHDPVLYDFSTRVIGSPHAIDVSGEINPRGPEVMQTMSKTMRGATSLSRLTESCIATSTHAFEQALRNDQRFVEGKSMPLYELCGSLLYDITYNMFFGYPASAAKRTEEKTRLYDDFKIYFNNSALLVTPIPVAFLPQVKKARENLINLLGEFDTKDRVGVSDLIQSITRLGKDHKGERARHLLIILWSAQANSRPALFWLMLRLMQHPEVGEKILEEYDEIMQEKIRRTNEKETQEASMRNTQKDQPLLSDWLGMAEIANVDRKDLDKMVVLDACIKESLRMSGSSLAIREATKDTSVKTASGRKYRIRKGDRAAVFSQVVDMHPTIHERPEEYIYNRYLTKQDPGRKVRNKSVTETDFSDSETDEANTSKSSSKSHWKAKSQFGVPGYKVSSSRALLTFGFGTTRCPGRHIALIELKLCVLLFLRHFNVSFVDPNQEAPQRDRKHLGFGVMPPMTDVEVNITPRRREV